MEVAVIVLHVVWETFTRPVVRLTIRNARLCTRSFKQSEINLLEIGAAGCLTQIYKAMHNPELLS